METIHLDEKYGARVEEIDKELYKSQLPKLASSGMDGIRKLEYVRQRIAKLELERARILGGIQQKIDLIDMKMEKLRLLKAKAGFLKGREYAAEIKNLENEKLGLERGGVKK